MKKSIIMLLLIPILSLAQVGVNTTAPKAALDVESSNNGMLIPRVQLTSILDNTTVVNPNTGPLETSTLVYNMAPAGVVPNNVVAGFYYWNNAAIPAQWVPVARGTSWNLFGNSGTNTTTLFDSNFTPTEKFIGTTDYQDLYIGTNNYPRIKINAFGNVGIGTDNPNAKLHIHDTSPYITGWITKTNVANAILGYVSPTFVVNTTSTSSGISDKNYSAQFSSAGTNISTNIAASFNATGAANNYAIVVPENSGDVGIGTETPTTKLHIEKASAGAVRIVDGTQAAGRVLTSDATGVATWQSVGTLGPAWSVNGNSAINTPTIPVTYGTSTIGATQNFMGTTNANSVVFGTNNIERMRILSTGNVGIGLATAPAKLAVFGGFLSPTYPNATTNGMLRIGNNTEGLDIGKAGFANNYASWLQSGFNGNPDPLSLQPLGGNVGIGTTNPSNLLHVNSATSGAVRIVDGTQAAGRVLTSNATGVGTWQNPTPSGFTHYLGELYLGGIIYELYKGSDGLEHGLIVSLTESSRVWQTIESVTNTNRTEDGAYNTSLMINSPAATYVASLGAGWYIPSVDELKLLYNNRYYANKALRAGGYTILSLTGLYWSSNEYLLNAGLALFTFSGNYGPQDKTDSNTVRAIRSF